MKRREIFWLIGITTLILLLNFLLFGLNGFNSDAVIDINVHDTYFVISNFDVLLIIGASIFFSVYIIRALNHKFRNSTANFILIISIIALSILLAEFNTFLNTYIELVTDWTVHPSSKIDIENGIVPQNNNLNIISSILFYFNIVLLIFLAYCGFKTGRNYKSDG